MGSRQNWDFLCARAYSCFLCGKKTGLNQRELFYRHVGQTSPAPLALEIVKADCCTLYDAAGREYIDLIGGISVANTGHRHPRVIAAIQQQLESYLHIMVYGEMVESPQVRYAQRLTEFLPASLNSVYFTNSGAEATEAACKLAKRVTGRTGMIAFKNAYHGSTQGALSLIGDEYWRNAYRPLLPGILHLDYNDPSAFDYIDSGTACVVAETVQAESGIKSPSVEWMRQLQARCRETGTLLVLDEIQAGFGRTGKLWGFEHFGVVPDLLLLGKALGGGMPLGALVADKKLMDAFTENPVLGHITTFGGHPVCCAAGLAALEALLEEGWIDQVNEKENLFRSLLQHPKIKAVSSFGLWMAVEFESFEVCKRVIDDCIAYGVLTDWFLFAPHCLRISPPLIISEAQIRQAAQVICQAADRL